ncbi:MAG: PD40 domain-containing protein, partial [Deltaproteobacteria bacterium]|nr:PD40 domain-containing protein [Deltaproteobacteria bacterium]
DGKGILFTVMRRSYDSQPWLALLRTDTREWRVLLNDVADARYVPTGHLVFMKRGTLMAVRFDLAGQKIIGQPVPIRENVLQTLGISTTLHSLAGQFGISATGALVYARGDLVLTSMASLFWVDMKGTEELATDLRRPFLAPRLSPDGQRIAYQSFGIMDEQIWVYDLERSTNSRLTEDGSARWPIWSPDGKKLLYAWSKSLKTNLYRQPYDGASPMERLTTSEYTQHPGSWSADGKTVALVEWHPDTGNDIYILDVLSGDVTPFLNSKYEEIFPDFSPDGRWMAYTSNESGHSEVYLRSFPTPDMKHLVSAEGGAQPLWARDGRRLFYRTRDQV